MQKLNNLIFENITKHTGHKAVIWDTADGVQICMTYQELEVNSRLVKDILVQSGGKFESLVAFSLEDHLYLSAPIITGILESGCSFLYLASDSPLPLIHQLLQLSKASFFISDKGVTPEPPWILSKHFTLLGRNLFLWRSSGIEGLQTVACADPIAYVITTSGSTGTPKIVRVPHKCIVPNILDFRERFHVTDTDVVFMASPLTFDPSIVDLFVALSTGATVLVVPEAVKRTPEKLAKLLSRHRVSFIQATPSLFLSFGPRLSRKFLLSSTSSLRALLLGGEVFPNLDTIAEYRESGNRTRFFNIYGITEVSCWASVTEVKIPDIPSRQKKSRSNNEISLGEPLSQTELRVRDVDGETVSEGDGVLYIGGSSRYCYIDTETELNSPVFRSSGDLVTIHNGKIYYKGRADFTVKRMGKRLSLESVEETARNSKLIRESAVVFTEEKRLILFCAAREKSDSLAGNLTDWFQLNCRSHERPDEFRFVEKLPLTRHGKIDRILLQKMAETSNKTESGNSVDFQSILEELWTRFCKRKPGRDSNFITDGGDSLSALNFTHEFKDKFQVDVPLLVEFLLNKAWPELLSYVDGCLQQDESFNPDSRVSLQSPAEPRALTNPEVDILRKGMYRREDLEIPSTPKLKLKWTYDLKKCIDASPLILNDRRTKKTVIFIGSHSSLFAAVDLVTGQEIWQVSLGHRIESSACSSTDGSRVIVGCYGGFLHCLDAQSGQVMRKYQTQDQIKCSPIVVGQYVICGSHDRYLHCVDWQNGQLRWRTRFSAGSVFASPVFCPESATLYAAALDGSCAALDIRSGTPKWTKSLKNPVFSSPVLLDGCVLFGCVDGNLYCFHSNGDILWQFTARGPIFSTPCIAREEAVRIVVGCHGNALHCINERGESIWTFETESPVYSTPSVVNFRGRDLVFLASTNGILHVLELANGREVARVTTNGEIFSSPVIFEDRIIVGCRDNYLYCFEIN